MLLSSIEVAMQTMASFLSNYLDEKKSVSVITKDGLKQMVKEQFPHCEKEEIRPGVYQIRIPLTETCRGYSPFNFQEVEDVDINLQINLFAEFLEMKFILEDFVFKPAGAPN
ncbi:UNVERIFIED_CONTAM: hypothetical protein K2H54_021869 [Gekko kuhli]